MPAEEDRLRALVTQVYEQRQADAADPLGWVAGEVMRRLDPGHAAPPFRPARRADLPPFGGA